MTNNAAVAERLRSLRDHGRDDHYRHAEVGYCSRLDGMQAAFLSVKLRHLAGWTEARRTLAQRYDELGTRMAAIGHPLDASAGPVISNGRSKRNSSMVWEW